MLKVCHITTVHAPEDGRIFRRACVSSSKAGYKTFLIQRGSGYKKNGVRIIGLGEPTNKSRLYRMTAFALKAYKKAVRVNADLYQIHDPELLPFALLLKLKGKKVVFDSHENYFDMMKRKSYLPFSETIGKIAVRFIRFAYSKLDGITYPCNDKYYQELKKICHTVCTTGNYPWRFELYDKYVDESQREPCTACFIGTLSEDYGVTEMIKACHKAGYKLYLAGKFYSEDYKKKVLTMPEASCLSYFGVIDREQVEALLKRTEVGLCVLHNIGQFYSANILATKVYEYMAMSVPVILNKTPYNEAILKRFDFGRCVSPMDIDAISKELVEMKDRSYREKLGRNGRDALNENYLWDNEQYNLLNMYKAILSEE